jgi:hypothetical protein
MKKGTFARVDYTLIISAVMMAVVTAITIMAAVYINANSVDPSAKYLERIALVMKTRKFSVVENNMGNPAVIRVQDLSLGEAIRRHGKEHHLLCRPVDTGSPFEAPLLPRVAAETNFCIAKDGSS